MMPGAGGDVNTTTPLVLNIVGTVLCSGTCVGALACIVGIVFAIQASNLKKSGDLANARKKAKLSMNIFIAAMAVGLLGYALLMIFRPA